MSAKRLINSKKEQQRQGTQDCNYKMCCPVGVTLCIMDMYQRFAETCCLHIKGRTLP